LKRNASHTSGAYPITTPSNHEGAISNIQRLLVVISQAFTGSLLDLLHGTIPTAATQTTSTGKARFHI
ncbi:MAG: hypothetical protein ABW185_10925, partial [Sedimenticola sp.]